MVARLLGSIRNPAQFVLAAFVLLSLIGTLLLRLPWATDAGQPALGWHDSLFWATSAATITGLGPTDVSVFSLYGELVLLVLAQIGGFGIMTIGSVLAIVASRRIGLRQRMLARVEIGSVDVGELRTLILAIAKITLAVEAAVALALFPTFAAGDESLGRAGYSAVYHSVMSFNNAGISLYDDSLDRYAGNVAVTATISLAFILGGLGFPILVEFIRRTRPRHWSLHTRITLSTTAVLLVVGPLLVLLFEWRNPDTLGPFGVWDKLQAAWFQGVTPRTAGFHTIDIASEREQTLNAQTALMFIGAGPASTSGGIKVTTFAVLGFAMWSEVRGDQDVNVFRRRIPPAAIRQAMTMALLAVGVVFGVAIVLGSLSDFAVSHTLFESASAFGTTGLTTGVTRELPNSGQTLLMMVMLAGRVGPVTFVTALALRERSRAYRFAEERPILG